jgi:hypothetical protein
MADLVPLAGGAQAVDPLRGHRPALALLPRGCGAPGQCAIGELNRHPGALIHDPMLGFLGALRECGRWHLDWPRVYARETEAGLAVTLLWQRSPRLVDILVGDGVVAEVVRCPRHGTPTVLV